MQQWMHATCCVQAAVEPGWALPHKTTAGHDQMHNTSPSTHHNQQNGPAVRQGAAKESCAANLAAAAACWSCAPPSQPLWCHVQRDAPHMLVASLLDSPYWRNGGARSRLLVTP
jgi:hypothetical protein